MREFLNITKALSDENRVRILMFLRDGELCLCQIIEMLGLASSTVSKHMSILFQAGLVHARKEGRWRYFRLPGRDATSRIKKCLQWTNESLSEEKIVIEDSKKLTEVLKIPMRDFCKNYSTRK